MTPTTRAALALAALAALSLVLPLGVTVCGVLALLGAWIVDVRSVRNAPQVRREVDLVLSRGVATAFTVQAASADARRVLLRQPASGVLAVNATATKQALSGEIVASARGRHMLPGVASASVGPLGLARWHHADGGGVELQVYPDLQTARKLALRLRQGRAAPDGRLRRGPLGLGTDFESIRDYAPDDDIRQVNWRATARAGRAMSNQYRVEQDRDVVCLIDTGRLMAAPAGHGTLLDAALDASTAVALVADELGDHCGAIAFAADIQRSLSPRRLGGRGVVQALFDLQPTLVDSDFERAFLRVGGSRRGVVFVFTDLIDAQAARALVSAAAMLSRRHAVIVASVVDEELEQLAHGEESYRALAAASVLSARAQVIKDLRRAGADVVASCARRLPESCVQVYLRAKARARV